MYTIVLAGGLGKRMNSDIPKVLHKVNDIPMICHVIREAFKLDATKILVVVGKYKTKINTAIQQFLTKSEYRKIVYVIQEEQIVNGSPKTMGTGDAIRCCIPKLTDLRRTGKENVVILSGDVPLIKHTTIKLLTDAKNTLLTSIVRNPFGCGRIFLNDNNEIAKIVEEKDCDYEQQKCNHVNCGIYNLNIDTIIDYIPLITNNNKSEEYYLTDVVEIARNNNVPINSVRLPVQNASEILNVNTPTDLKIANSQYKIE